MNIDASSTVSLLSIKPNKFVSNIADMSVSALHL